MGEALGGWVESCEADFTGKRNESPSPLSPVLSKEVSPRMEWAKATTLGPLASADASAKRAQARSEVCSAVAAFLSNGSVFCLPPVAAPPPLPSGAADVDYRQRTFEL